MSIILSPIILVLQVVSRLQVVGATSDRVGSSRKGTETVTSGGVGKKESVMFQDPSHSLFQDDSLDLEEGERTTREAMLDE